MLMQLDIRRVKRTEKKSAAHPSTYEFSTTARQAGLVATEFSYKKREEINGVNRLAI